MSSSSTALSALSWNPATQQSADGRLLPLEASGCKALAQAFRVHGLPDGEIALEFDVCVWSREGSRSGRCVDDLMIDHFDDALAAL